MWGEVDEHVIGHLVNPSFMGGPSWPATRQAHVIVRRDGGGGLLLASDGLADPIEWDDAPPSNGFGAEVYAMTADTFEDTGTTGLAGEWLGRVVMATSQIVAGNGPSFARMLAENGTLTVGFPNAQLPGEHGAKYMDEAGSLVVMLGLTGPEIPDSVDGPLSSIRLVNIKLLTAAEAAFCIEGGRGDGSARTELVTRFAAQGHVLWSSLYRPSVV